MDRGTDELEQADQSVWDRLLNGASGLMPLYEALLAPLAPARSFVLGRIAQSLDGYIAAPGGDSFWISGPEDILHTHRLRALCDAVIVGAGTVRADNPQLTTRACRGASPIRVVIDPAASLHAGYRVFSEGPPTLVARAPDTPERKLSRQVDCITIPRDGANGQLDMAALIAALHARGLRRVLVEGGGRTLSWCLQSGVLHRMHVTIAPLVLGGGIPAFALRPPHSLASSLRLTWEMYPLGTDILLDIPLAATSPL